MTYDDRNNKAIKTCDPWAQVAMRHFMYRLSRAGEDVLITEGFRNEKKQNQEYAEGDSQVKFPYSFHNHGVAIDLVPVLFGQTKIIYKAAERYARIARIADQCGFKWGYALWGFDKPHFHYNQGNGIEYFIAGGKLNEDPAKDEARAYYEGEHKKIYNAMKHASSYRLKKLQDEAALLEDLLKDCDK